MVPEGVIRKKKKASRGTADKPLGDRHYCHLCLEEDTVKRCEWCQDGPFCKKCQPPQRHDCGPYRLRWSHVPRSSGETKASRSEYSESSTHDKVERTREAERQCLQEERERLLAERERVNDERERLLD